MEAISTLKSVFAKAAKVINKVIAQPLQKIWHWAAWGDRSPYKYAQSWKYKVPTTAVRFGSIPLSFATTFDMLIHGFFKTAIRTLSEDQQLTLATAAFAFSAAVALGADLSVKAICRYVGDTISKKWGCVTERCLPASLRPMEDYFPELKTLLKETLRRELKNEFEKRSHEGFRPDPKTGVPPKISREDFEKFNGEWEDFFDSSVTIEYQKNASGTSQGRICNTHKVEICVADDFDAACNNHGIHPLMLLQSTAAKFMQDRGYDVKNFKPKVSVCIRKSCQIT